MKLSMHQIIVAIGVASLLLYEAGCATVDPHIAYLNAGNQIVAATGAAESYDPGVDEGVVADRVDELLSDGMTSKDAVQICLLNNPRLRAAFLDIGVAQADWVQAGLFSNPFVGLSARFPDGGGLANIDASVAQNIAELWQIPLRRRVAQHELDQAVLRTARLAATLAAECKSAYYDAVGQSERLTITRENLENATSLLETALARERAGAATKLDVNLSRSLTIDAELAVETARLAVSDARRKLVTLLGLEADAKQLRLVDGLPDPPPDMPDAEALVASAMEWRLDIQTARQAVSAAEWRLQEQQQRIFPVVELGVELEREDRRPDSGRNVLADTARASIAHGGLTAPEIEPRSARHSAKSQDVIVGPGLGFELPIFDQNQARIAKARYRYEQSIRTLEALKCAVTQEVRGSVDRAMTTWRVARMYRERSLPVAKSNLELSRRAYEAGQTSFLSVLEAQRFFLNSRSGYVEAVRTAAIAIPGLERTVGLPFDRMLNPNPGPPEVNVVEDNTTEESNP